MRAILKEKLAVAESHLAMVLAAQMRRVNSLQSVALARIRLGDSVTALQSTANALEDALRLTREKFPDLQNQPHDEVAIALAELSHASLAPIAAHKIGAH